jgi:death-on-curing protein
MTQFTTEEVKGIHDDLIRKGGKARGIICEGTIDFIVDKINYDCGIYMKASWALYMSRLNPFVDGNKRTSFVLALMILRMNGHWVGIHEQEEFFEVLHKISDANVDCDVDRIGGWLRNKSAKWWKLNQRPLTDYL